MATIGERSHAAVETAQQGSTISVNQGCTISVTPEIRALADELAHLLRLDGDTFVASSSMTYIRTSRSPAPWREAKGQVLSVLDNRRATHSNRDVRSR